MSRKKTAHGRPASQDRGFAEGPQSGFVQDQKLGFGIENRLRLTLGPGGRLVIPAALRGAMEVEEGDAILAWVEAGELHLLSPRVGARQAQEMFKGLVANQTSLADELIAERRAEADSRG